MLPCSLQSWWNLVENLSREIDACRAYRQAGNPQRLGRPCVAGAAKIVRSSGGMEDAFGIETGTNAARSSFLVCSQIVPQQLRETFDTTRRHMDNNSVRNPEKRLRAILSGMTSLTAGPEATARRMSPMPGFRAM